LAGFVQTGFAQIRESKELKKKMLLADSPM